MSLSVDDHPELKAQLINLKAELEEKLHLLKAEVSRIEQELEGFDKLLMPAAPVLSGDSLRVELHAILKELDPGQAGIHYQDLNKEIRARGFDIGGKSSDKAPNVRAHLSYGPKAAKMFRHVGKNQGMYTWQ